MGICERSLGYCSCYDGYEGLACEKRMCPEDCNIKYLYMNILFSKLNKIYIF
jgi:hypothetical protein